MLKIPTKVWSKFSTILRLPGSEGLANIQSEVVPVQDLSRIMQADRVDRMAYSFTNTPAASATTTLQWNDVSDWDQVRKNGIIVGADNELPALTDDRIIISMGLEIGGVDADYTSCEAVRVTPFTTIRFVQLAAWAAIVASHNAPTLTPPLQLPQYLLPGETDMRLVQIVTGIGADFNFVVQMVAAEPGVMAAYGGI